MCIKLELELLCRDIKVAFQYRKVFFFVCFLLMPSSYSTIDIMWLNKFRTKHLFINLMKSWKACDVVSLCRCLTSAIKETYF